MTVRTIIKLAIKLINCVKHSYHSHSNGPSCIRIFRVYATSIYRIGQPVLSNPNHHAIFWHSGYGQPRILEYVQISSHAISVWMPIK